MAGRHGVWSWGPALRQLLWQVGLTPRHRELLLFSLKSPTQQPVRCEMWKSGRVAVCVNLSCLHKPHARHQSKTATLAAPQPSLSPAYARDTPGHGQLFLPPVPSAGHGPHLYGNFSSSVSPLE